MSWKTFFMGVGTVAILLLAWLLAVLIGHRFGFSVSDTGGLLSVLGGIMGAVFAAAGIAVALISLFEQMQLRDRIEQLVEKKFNELRIEYEEHTQHLIDASLAVFQATNVLDTGDWRQAEELIREGLRKNPLLAGASSILGLRMSAQVQEDFARLLSLSPTVGAFAPPTSAVAGTLPPVKAIRWLDEALRSGDSQIGRVNAELALMYGYSRAFDDMLENLRESLKQNPALYPYLQVSSRLMMLIYACNTRASIEEVMSVLHKELPKKEDIVQALKDVADPKVNPYAATNMYADWYAVELHMGNTSGAPIKVRIFAPDKTGSTYALIFRQGQLSTTVPPQNNPMGLGTSPIDDLLRQWSGPVNGMLFITVV